MLLTWLWLGPAAAALLVWATPGGRDSRAARRAAGWAATGFAGLFLAYALWLLVPFSAETGTLRLEEIGAPGPYGIRYRLGVDGVSLALCWLNALLTFLALAAAKPDDHPPAYWAAFLALEAAVMGVFTSQNLLYFLIFWDSSLLPMFLIIGLWGSEARRRAAVKFVLYAFAGSLALLAAFAALPALHQQATGRWTLDIPDLLRTPAGTLPAAVWVFGALAAGFGVKVPLVPLHSWLPDAHTEAPAAGSVLLAGVLLKLGVYGFLRVLVPVFPELAARSLPILGGLAAAGILYGAACAIAQSDLKRLVAFTSVSHLGCCVLGIFSLTAEGLAGGTLQLVNHGLSTGGLFLLVGMLYERSRRRGVSDFGGLAKRAPSLAFFFALILLSSIGLPGLNGFVGEAMSLAGAFRAQPWLAAAGLGGAVLAAAYGLPAFQKVFWEPEGAGSVSSLVADLSLRERAVLWVLAALIVWLGVYPKPVLDLLEPALLPLVAR